MRARSGRSLLLVSAIAVAVLVGCGSDGDGSASPSVTQQGETDPSTPVTEAQDPSTTTEATTTTAPAGDPEVVAATAGTASGPIQLLPRPGDDGVLWLAERAGRILRVPIAADGTFGDGEVVLDISDETSVDAERGLLSFAFATDGATIYVSSTDPAGDTRVEAYPVGDDGTVDAAGGEVVYAIAQPFPNHNGGHVAIGPDGALWLGLGDGGSRDDPDNRAQDPTTDLGSMVRIDLETGSSEIAVMGLRNPWRWAFDVDDSLWIADVGQASVEEVDRLPAGEIEGANLGWSGFEGTDPYLDGDGRRPADAVDPVFQYTHDNGNCSITGGFVYRGTAIPALDGWFLFADYCAGSVRAIVLGDDGTFARELDLGIDVTSPISFGRDAEGEPYVLSEAGDVIRIAPA